MRYILLHPITGKILLKSDSWQEITTAAIDYNNADPGHVSIWILDIFSNQTACLYRKFGQELDPRDCWREIG